MRWWRKVALWAFSLLVCAGIGAFVASRTNPFPPEVQVASPSPSGTPSPSVEPPTRWRLTLTSRTSHAYRVGGSCTSDWRMRARFRVEPDGAVTGQGVAHLRPGAGCDFPSGQVQAAAVVIRIGGARKGRSLDLRLRPLGVEPPGSQDLGGFVRTLPATRFSIGERDGARVRRSKRIEDPEDEIQRATTTLILSR
jgi:hypothetical protein